MEVISALSPYTDPNSNVPFSRQSIYKIAAATCPSGKRVIGGGSQVVDFHNTGSADVPHTEAVAHIHVAASYPSSESTWTAEAGADAGFPWQLQAYAMCAPIAP
jgi:hypothetical protein